jgi:hypothetical protein
MHRSVSHLQQLDRPIQHLTERRERQIRISGKRRGAIQFLNPPCTAPADNSVPILLFTTAQLSSGCVGLYAVAYEVDCLRGGDNCLDVRVRREECFLDVVQRAVVRCRAFGCAGTGPEMSIVHAHGPSEATAP